MSLLVLSTLPHYVSLLPLVYYYNDTLILYYMFVILTSSTLSVLYHSKYNNVIIELFDHVLALFWFMYDVYLGYALGYALLFQIIFYNTLSFMVYQKIEIECTREKYYIFHSGWHLLNTFKSFYISYLISLYLEMPNSIKIHHFSQNIL